MPCEVIAAEMMRKMKKMSKSYSEMSSFKTFKQRYDYLKLSGVVGEETFGYNRWANQRLYHSQRWLRFKDKIIIRDNGCDLAVDGYDIGGPIIIHHINPITYDDIINDRPCVFDLENVVCTKLATHNGIHYGSEMSIIPDFVVRTKNDTCPWKNSRKEGGLWTAY